MQEARTAGCHSPAEIDTYCEQRRREAGDSVHMANDGSQMGLSSHGAFMGSLDPRVAGQGSSSSANSMEMMGYSGADLLSENVSFAVTRAF